MVTQHASTPDANYALVKELSGAIYHGGARLEAIPGLLKQVIQEGCWREYSDALHELRTFTTFTEFVTSDVGLRTSVSRLQRLCYDDPEALDLLDRETALPVGANQYTHAPTEGHDNIMTQNDTGATQGTSAAYALRRLRAHPALHARVLARELSPHAAMLEAGLRRPRVSIPTDKIRDVLVILQKHFSKEDLRMLCHLLQESEG